ncbi:MAG: hypothetical protein ACRCX8_14345 [Sarcina sp.]
MSKGVILTCKIIEDWIDSGMDAQKVKDLLKGLRSEEMLSKLGVDNK